MKRPIIIHFAAVAILMTGCFKDVSYHTTYVLKPLQQPTSDDKNPSVIPGASAYAFDADTTAWTVATYDDAVRGVLTSKMDPAQQISTPFASSEPYSEEGWLRLQIDRESQMVVAVDPVNRLYAYTQQMLGENLGNLFVSVVFQPWKAGFSYKNGNWSFYNEFYEPPVFLTVNLDIRQQAVENGPEAKVEKLTAYAYAADTTVWHIASYNDAVVGKITEKEGTKTRTNPDFRAYPVADSPLYGMEVSDPTLMIVVVDQTHRIYAYTQRTVDLEGESPTFEVLFRVWQKIRVTTWEGWCMVDDTVSAGQEDDKTPSKR